MALTKAGQKTNKTTAHSGQDSASGLSAARAQLHFLLAVALQQSDTHRHGATVTKLPDAIPFVP